MNKSKYILLYNGVPFTADSIEEIARKIFGLKVERGESGSWEVYINGENVAHYSSTETQGKNGYTREEAEKHFLRRFKPGGYKNTALYKLAE